MALSVDEPCCSPKSNTAGSHDVEEDGHDTPPLPGRGPWPEDDDNDNELPLNSNNSSRHHRHQYFPTLHKWSFSYMNCIFTKGAEIHTHTKQQQREYYKRRRSRRTSITTSSDNGDTTTTDDNGQQHQPQSIHQQQHQQQGMSGSTELRLTMADLYRTPSSMKLSNLRPQFNQYYTSNNGNLLKTLWQLSKPSFLPAGTWQFLVVLCQAGIPMLIWQLLRILEANPSSNIFHEAIPYVMLILVADIVNAFAMHRNRYLSMQCGVMIRTALLGAMYERILNLSSTSSSSASGDGAVVGDGVAAARGNSSSGGGGPAARGNDRRRNSRCGATAAGPSSSRSASSATATATATAAAAAAAATVDDHRIGAITTGAVTTLFAIDTQKLFEVTAEGHLLWSAPLSMLLVTIFLMIVVGPSMAMGIVLLILFIPLVKVSSNRIMSIRKQRVKVTDTRVEIVNAMLQGIMVTKLNHYEERYIERLKKVREEELRLLRQELYVWSMVMAIQFASPIFASMGAFAAYVLMGNVLTTADAFTALLLFNSLRFPINYASRLVGKVAQARDSAQRISNFMSMPTSSTTSPRSGVGGLSSTDEGGTSNTEWESNSAVRISSPIIERKNAMNDAASARNWADRSSPAVTDDDIDTQQPLQSDENNNKKPLLVVRNGKFCAGNVPTNAEAWEAMGPGASSTGFTVDGVNMSVKPGEILAIAGPVGSGKSTIINAIIGEVSVSPMTVLEKHGKVAYASQGAFILNATLRENILFGSAYHADRYNQVLDACCLRLDIENLSPAGDQTEIGERGVTLSGGQKQRVSLARVVYSNPDIALFDDPLSALDAGTSRNVFDRLFQQDGRNLLSNTAVVLVTHSSHFLHRVNQIMVVVDGKVPFHGTWGELSEVRVDDDPKAKIAIESILNAVQESNKNAPRHSDFNRSSLRSTQVSAFREAMLQTEDVAEGVITPEAREHGLTRAWAWTLWFRHSGGVVFTLGVSLLLILEKAFYFLTEWWLLIWTEATDSPTMFIGVWFPPQSIGIEAQSRYLAVYGIMLTLAVVCAFFRTVWIVSGGIRCSKKLYSVMTHSVLHSPMVYFETTPMGRLLNRFTYDTEILDVTLVWCMSLLLISLSWFATSLIVMVAILPWMFVVLVPLSILYMLTHFHYRKSGADLQRLDALSRSSLHVMLSEAVEGSATIRTFRKIPTFIDRFQGFADESTAAQMNFIAAQRWLGVRIGLLGAVVVFVACLLVVTLNKFFNLSAGFVALLVRWSAGFTVALGILLDNATEAEGAVTAIERIQKMTEIQQEPGFVNGESVDISWPSRGELEFRDVKMRYRPKLPLSLDGLSFRVKAGEHCGVVGRTGAGKSSLFAALFRLVELEDGTITIDDIDLSTVRLSAIRGRPNGISIIPQNPLLFAGTLRECLDPFGLSTDDKLLDALASVRMLPSRKGNEILNSRVEEGGSNFSVGERSLLLLARVMLARPKLLFMDEATANIDGETDSFIQRMLRTRFAGTTLITIAHRLETIMDYDKVLVMADGQAAEFGPPYALIEKNGIFTDLVHATGEGAAVLIAMAKEASEQQLLIRDRPT
ncbi:hypothetical protein ACHAXH_004865 [Discostella pseudostelligera]